MESFTPESSSMAKIAVIGAGYVGLVSAAGLCHLGHTVRAIDIDPERVRQLEDGQCPIYEVGLPALLKEGRESGRLSFALGSSGIGEYDYIYLCLPTPSNPDGSADTSYVETATRDIAPHLKSGAVIVTKSTVPVGMGKKLETIIDRNDIEVVSNPEFLREGSAVGDFMQPDRIVVGAQSFAVADRVASLYKQIETEYIITDRASSELIKYCANAFLATKLSFINTVASLCEVVGANITDVARGIGSDSRIGPKFLKAGPGYGGSCFPKDTLELMRLADEAEVDFAILRGAIDMNNSQFDHVVNKVADAIGGDLLGSHIAVWGIAFKSGTDDTRFSPAVAIITRLLAAGATVLACDPEAQAPPSIARHGGFKQVSTPAETVVDADAIITLTEWPQYGQVDLEKAAESMTQRVIIDARNLYDGPQLVNCGWVYASIGQATMSPKLNAKHSTKRDNDPTASTSQEPTSQQPRSQDRTSQQPGGGHISEEHSQSPIDRPEV